MLHDLTGVKFQNFFELDTCSKTRGHFLKLKKNRFNSNVRRHFFTERIINIWNNLDEQTVSASSLNSFKYFKYYGKSPV